MFLRATVWLVGLLFVVGLATACGERPDVPIERAGTYVLDRQATAAALRNAAVAMSDEQVTARMNLPDDPRERAGWLEHQRQFWERQAKSAVEGMFDQELELRADGTWRGRSTRSENSVGRSGTWSTRGQDLYIVMTSPMRDDDFHARFTPNGIQFLQGPDLVIRVLKRE